MVPALITIFAAAAFAAVWGWASSWRLKRRLALIDSKAKALTAELQALKGEPKRWEGRLERYELLWFPSITYDPEARRAIALAVGVPHCRSCVRPLSLQGREWACGECGSRHPESVADVAVLDLLAQEAARHFLERHPGYEMAGRKA